jgi:hypothetical protein
MQSIKRMYRGLNLDREAILHKAKLLLKIYRDVVWVSIREARSLADEALDMYGSCELGAALDYLTDLAPTEQRKDFEAKVTYLFENQWIVELIDRAMQHVYKYPHNGKLYKEILSNSYVVESPYTETELLESLNLERSIFYERKREAVMLLGVVLWGYAIPEFKDILNQYYDGGDELGQACFAGMSI